MAYSGWLPSARVGIYTSERSVRMRTRIMGLIRTPPIPENPSGTLVLGAIWSWIRDRLDATFNGRW